MKVLTFEEISNLNGGKYMRHDVQDDSDFTCGLGTGALTMLGAIVGGGAGAAFGFAFGLSTFCAKPHAY